MSSMKSKYRRITFSQREVFTISQAEREAQNRAEIEEALDTLQHKLADLDAWFSISEPDDPQRD